MGIDVNTALTIKCRDSALLAELYNWLCESIQLNLKNSERNKNAFIKYPYINEIFKDIMADSIINEYQYGGVIEEVSQLQPNSFSVKLWHKFNYESGDATAIIPFWYLNNRARFGGKLRYEYALRNEVSDEIVTNIMANKGKYLYELYCSDVGEITLYPEIWDNKDKLFNYCLANVNIGCGKYNYGRMDTEMVIPKSKVKEFYDFVHDSYHEQKVYINGHNWILDRLGRVSEYKFMKLDDFIQYNLGLYKYKKDWETWEEE